MTSSPRHPTWIAVAVAVALTASWAARGHATAPPGRYMPMGATVLDTQTMLLWELTPAVATYTWSNAQNHCTGLNLNGTGWRVPSMKELQTIVDETQNNPAVDGIFFSSTPSDYFWTSSLLAGDPSNAWNVNFGDGTTDVNAESIMYTVRCVR